MAVRLCLRQRDALKLRLDLCAIAVHARQFTRLDAARHIGFEHGQTFQRGGNLIHFRRGGARVPVAFAHVAGYPQPREWKDRTDGIRSEGLKTGELVVDGEWLTLAPGKKQHTVGLSSKSYGDVALRVVFANEAYVALRLSDGDGYNLGIANTGKIWLYRKAAGATDLKSGIGLGSGYVAAAGHELVFAAQGDKLTLWMDGKEIASVRDGSYRSGTMAIDFHGNSRIKKIETGDLETTAPAPK